MNRETSPGSVTSLLSRKWKALVVNERPAFVRPRHVWVTALLVALLAADAAAYSLFNLTIREAAVHSAVLNVLIWTAFLAIAAWHAPREVRASLTGMTICT